MARELNVTKIQLDFLPEGWSFLYGTLRTFEQGDFGQNTNRFKSWC